MIEQLIGILFLLFFGYITIGSSYIVSEKKKLYREGKRDYHGNPIENNDND